MKKNILIIGLAGMIGMSSGFISCSPDYETEFNVEKLVVPDKSQAPIIFSLKGGESEIIVETNVPFGNWTAESNAEWCKLTPQENKVIVSTGENNIYKQRKAEITIAYGHQSYSITVSQFGLEPKILVDGEEGEVTKVIDPTVTELTIPVATNLKLDNILVPDTCDWVHFVEPGKAIKALKEGEISQQDLKFTLDQNTDTVVRYCTVTLQSSDNYAYATTFIIKQQKRGYIVDIDDAHKVYEVKAMGETITVPFKVNGPADAEYEYTIEEKAQEWIKPAPLTRGALRDASESFIIEPNTAVVEQPREGTITFTSKDPVAPNSFTVTVKQAGFIPAPPVNVINAVATPIAGQISLQWETPEDVDYSKVKITYYDKVTKENKEIEIDGYKTTSAIINDTYQCAGEYTFTIKTYGPTNMETANPVTVTGTSGEATDKERIALTVDMLSANATQPGEGTLSSLVDNTTGTGDYYHTMWDRATSDFHYVQINLPKPLQKLVFEYDGRRNGDGGGDVLRAKIMGSNDISGEGNWEQMGTQTFTLPTARGGHATANETILGREEYKYIRFIPQATRKFDPLHPEVQNEGWWNMAKMYLYRARHDEAWAKEQLGI